MKTLYREADLVPLKSGMQLTQKSADKYWFVFTLDDWSEDSFWGELFVLLSRGDMSYEFEDDMILFTQRSEAEVFAHTLRDRQPRTD